MAQTLLCLIAGAVDQKDRPVLDCLTDTDQVENKPDSIIVGKQQISGPVSTIAGEGKGKTTEPTVAEPHQIPSQKSQSNSEGLTQEDPIRRRDGEGIFLGRAI